MSAEALSVALTPELFDGPTYTDQGPNDAHAASYGSRGTP